MLSLLEQLLKMYTTYHLTSAQEINSELLEAIKAIYKSKPITIIVQEDEDNAELSAEVKDLLNQRLAEDEETYFSGEYSLNQIRKKYGL